MCSNVTEKYFILLVDVNVSLGNDNVRVGCVNANVYEDYS